MLSFEKIRVALKYKNNYLRTKKKINQKTSKYLENIFFLKRLKYYYLNSFSSVFVLYALFISKENLAKTNIEFIMIDFMLAIGGLFSLIICFITFLKTFEIIINKKKINIEKKEFDKNMENSKYSKYLILKQLIIDIGNTDKDCFDKVEIFLESIDKEDLEIIKKFTEKEINDYFCNTDVESKMYDSLLKNQDKIDKDVYLKNKKEIDFILKETENKTLKVSGNEFSLNFYKFKNKILELEKEINTNIKSIDFDNNQFDQSLNLKEVILKGF